jgi:type IV fimbrial biogenesis protein FimT
MMKFTTLPRQSSTIVTPPNTLCLSGTQTGFTLIEVMIVIAIIGIVSAIGVPALQQAYQNQQVKSAASDAQLSFLLARSEAVKRNGDVRIDAITNGWQTTVVSDGTVLQTKNDLPADITVNCTGCPVIYHRTGRLETAVDLEFLHSSNTNITMRCVSTSLSGRPFVQLDSDVNRLNGCD